MGLDRHLFLMNIDKLDLTGLTSFYRSVLRAWSHFKFSRDFDGVQRLWLREEPLLFNFLMDLDIFKSNSLRKASEKITKIGHLINEGGWISAEVLALRMGMRSVRVAETVNSNK